MKAISIARQSIEDARALDKEVEATLDPDAVEEAKEPQPAVDIDVVEPTVEVDAAQEEVLPQDAADERLESVSQVQPRPSEISKLTGATFISQLQRQLDDERAARMKLEDELGELKKISSEINSQLSALQKASEVGRE